MTERLLLSVAVQWLRLLASSARVWRSIPGWGTNSPHAVWQSQKKKKKEKWKGKGKGKFETESRGGGNVTM